MISSETTVKYFFSKETDLGILSNMKHCKHTSLSITVKQSPCQWKHQW